MIIGLLLILSHANVGQMAVGFQVQNLNPAKMEVNVIADVAGNELRLIDRVDNLKQVTVRLPEQWKAIAQIADSDSQQEISKPVLMEEITKIENSSVRRWRLIVAGAAYIQAKPTATEADQVRVASIKKQFESLPSEQTEANKQLDSYSKKLSSGISSHMKNLAAGL